MSKDNNYNTFINKSENYVFSCLTLHMFGQLCDTLRDLPDLVIVDVAILIDVVADQALCLS